MGLLLMRLVQTGIKSHISEVGNYAADVWKYLTIIEVGR